jgi:hypothetical protein
LRVEEATVRITAAPGVGDAVRERGGRLYVWTRVHACCTGKTTLLETATERPRDPRLRFRELDAGGFALLLDLGAAPLPERLVLELRGRRRRIAAFWNDQGWVG